MRAIGLSIALALVLAGQVTSRFNGEIAAMAAALADHNPEEFLAHFDRRTPGYDELKANVRALTDQADIHSGIDEITDDGDQAVVDWIMELTSRTNGAQTERRHATVRLKFDAGGKHRKVISVEPANFFAPPRFAREHHRKVASRHAAIRAHFRLSSPGKHTQSQSAAVVYSHQYPVQLPPE